MGASDGPILAMPKRYSTDLRERAIESIEGGASRGRQTAMELAGGCDLGAQTWKTTGNIVAKSHCDTPLECESIYLSIGADVETILGCNQRLEMMKPAHRGTRSVKDWLASVSAKAVQPIVTLSPDYPDDRIGVSVAGRNNRRACTAESAAPGRAETRSLVCADLQDSKQVPRCLRRAMSPGGLHRDVEVRAKLIDRRCGPDRLARNSFG